VEVKNCMEIFVWEMLDQVLEKRQDVCKCESCRCDIVALALNDLPPRYVATEKGETYTRAKVLEQQFRIDVIAKVTQAASVVAQHPRHH
jgi:competence protein ComFB